MNLLEVESSMVLIPGIVEKLPPYLVLGRTRPPLSSVLADR
jgi:hypothetical protein